MGEQWRHVYVRLYTVETVVVVPWGISRPFFPQVWDERLARSAEAWATQCIWAHGPSQLMRYVGQNLSIHSGR